MQYGLDASRYKQQATYKLAVFFNHPFAGSIVVIAHK